MASGGKSVWYQREVQLKARPKGCHLLDDEVLGKCPEISKIKIGLAHILSKEITHN